MFVNLARRSQILVDRLIGHLDRLERGEEDERVEAQALRELPQCEELRVASVLLSGLSVIPPISAQAQNKEKQREPDWYEADKAEELPLLGLPIESTPLGIVSFNLNDSMISHPSGPRLAVLNFVPGTELNRLHIFKAEAGKLAQEFSLDLDERTAWVRLDTFPSERRLPGIVIRGGAEVTGNATKVVAYHKGKFQVVFEGHNADVVDLDHDDLPEIISRDRPVMDVEAPSLWRVWAWNGEKYVAVAHVEYEQVFSPNVLAAVKKLHAKDAPEPLPKNERRTRRSRPI